MCVACTQSAYVYLNVCRAEQMTQVNTQLDTSLTNLPFFAAHLVAAVYTYICLWAIKRHDICHICPVYIQQRYIFGGGVLGTKSSNTIALITTNTPDHLYLTAQSTVRLRLRL